MEPVQGAGRPNWLKGSQEWLTAEMVERYGKAQQARAERGIAQVSGLWREEDGRQDEFEDFVRANFAGDAAVLDAIFRRLELVMEQMDGHMHEIQRVLREPVDLDCGPILAIDEALAGYDISAHVLDDLFRNKLAFVVLLNFRLWTLEEKLTAGQRWSRREWAEARLAERFSKRVPAEVNQKIAQAATEADQYISEYNIWMHHLLSGRDEKRLFPAGMRLLSHWGLRDQIKADYQQADGLPRQRLIQRVMERIITQTIPEAVVNNPQVDWNVDTNEVRPAAVKDSEFRPPKETPIGSAPERDTRYAMWLKTFRAAKLEDAYSPTSPTHMARRFDEDRQIPEERFSSLLEQVLSSPLAPRIAAQIEKRLGRKLEPFDLWYSEFRPRSRFSESELDAMVMKLYPTADAYRRDIPNLLVKLGFTAKQAEYLAGNIEVDAARGAGHAMGASMRGAKAHLRTRVTKEGMNYSGFSVAAHEMGHNVEQVYSLNDVDHYLLNGVPNTAFTEAFAFVFQSRDLRLLGLNAGDGGEDDAAARMLNQFWQTFEISGVSLVDMRAWRWMYEHPEATASELKEATLTIAKDLWNRYYAPVFGQRDVVLLAVYSHMIDAFLYLPDYALGHMIASQLEQHLNHSGANFGAEVERMARFGNIAPDLWMKDATGTSVGPEALLKAAEGALERLGG
jgi:hypothetical protein